MTTNGIEDKTSKKKKNCIKKFNQKLRKKMNKRHKQKVFILYFCRSCLKWMVHIVVVGKIGWEKAMCAGWVRQVHGGTILFFFTMPRHQWKVILQSCIFVHCFVVYTKIIHLNYLKSDDSYSKTWIFSTPIVNGGLKVSINFKYCKV